MMVCILDMAYRFLSFLPLTVVFCWNYEKDTLVQALSKIVESAFVSCFFIYMVVISA